MIGNLARRIEHDLLNAPLLDHEPVTRFLDQLKCHKTLDRLLDIFRVHARSKSSNLCLMAPVL